MGIVFKVVDDNIKEAVGESQLIPIKLLLTSEY